MFIAIDVGGTQLRAALYPEDGIEPITRKVIPTSAPGETAENRLLDLIQSVWPENRKVEKIAAGVPAAVNPKTGIVYKAANIPNWVDFPLGKIIWDRFKTPTILGNDANLAALGEWKYGAAVGHHDLVYLTISTGIGSGIIIDDRLLVGPRGIAAEAGHITVLPDGPMCGCGHRGHLEAISSGTGIANYISAELKKGRKSVLSEMGDTPTARMATAAAQKGDALAIEAFDIAGTFLGRAIADFLHVFEPTIVVLGGGVTNAGELLMTPVWKAIRESVISPEYLRDFSIAFAKLGDQSGLVGALALARS
jgi:glucokinase